MMRVRDVLETCLYVDDLAAAEQFYHALLGLAVIAREPGRHVFFRCGQRVFLIFNAQETSRPDSDLPPHGAQGPTHVAFAVPLQELPAWRVHLEANGVAIERDVQWPRGGRSLYIRDPAGNSVELATPLIWGIDEPPAVRS